MTAGESEDPVLLAVDEAVVAAGFEGNSGDENGSEMSDAVVAREMGWEAERRHGWPTHRDGVPSAHTNGAPSPAWCNPVHTCSTFMLCTRNIWVGEEIGTVSRGGGRGRGRDRAERGRGTGAHQLRRGLRTDQVGVVSEAVIPRIFPPRDGRR